MATYVPAKRAVEYVFYTALIARADSQTLQSNPTLAAGDVQVSKDGGALANLTTLPAVTPASSVMVKVTLSSDEMTADQVSVVFIDAAGDEWCDQFHNIQTVARQVDDLAFPTTSGRSLDVTATGTVGIDWGNVENPTTAVNLSATNIDPDQVVASVTGAVGSVTGSVGGNVTGSVGSVATGGIAAASFAAGAIDAAAIADNAIDAGAIAANAITAAKIATGAIDADAVAADAVTEIQSGLATSAEIAALNDLSAAQVNAEVVDALATDTYAEPGQGAPASTATLAAKIGWLFKAFRNKHDQSATTFQLYNDDAATVDSKATVSDDGAVFTRGEIVSGP